LGSRLPVREKEPFLLCRHSNNTNLKTYYKRYCKILSNVILTAKKLQYNRIILNSNNKIATTWKIINYENGKPTAVITLYLEGQITKR
jgi:hypothetical protein